MTSKFLPVNVRDERTGRWLAHYDWDAVIAEICERVADGEAVKPICAEEHIPSWPVLWHKLNERADYKEAYERAKHAKAEGFDDKLDTLYRRLDPTALRDGETALDAKNARVMLEVLRVQRGHLAPNTYHDRTIGQTVTHEAGQSLRDRLIRANERTDVIEGQYDVVNQ